ncbi:hypothetical protein [Polaribacter sp.]|uniref:hypothetical protein n=1 Tax=Polaribacter sp. TaxID=1920175 RepID=UPI003F6C740D
MGFKKIDNLFQEQLKSLEVSPNERVWNNIETQLKKKKRSIFPFWWFSGAVASILVLVSIFKPFSDDVNQNNKPNSNEIITTIPKEKNDVQPKIDTLRKNHKSLNHILISKKVDILEEPKKNSIFSNKNEKKNTYQPKKNVATVLSSYHATNINLKTLQQDFILSTQKLEGLKSKHQGLDITNFTKNNEKSIAKKSSKNWSLAPVFAVLQSNSLTDTSPINASLASSTSGKNSYAYGVQIAYKLGERWSIQSGIQLQEMAYTNTQITIHTSSSNNPFATNFSNGAVFSFDTNVANENALLAADFGANTKVTNTGNLYQNFGYIEIPLEVKYNFSRNKKINTAIVTGFSTLFLNKNEVVLNTSNFSENLQAVNLSNLNFSGNLGFDFNYSFTAKWSFHVNPMVKVQLNTFTDNANGFAPFNLGIYSGIIYQF